MPDRTHANDIDELHPDDIELEKIPRGLWEQVLAPLPRSIRGYLARQVRDEHLQEAAWELVTALDIGAASEREGRLATRASAKRTGAPLPTPDADHPVTRPCVQINIRLRVDDHARLARAAESVGLPPTTLARALVLNGAAQVLRDSGAAEQRQ